ncbi:MAG: hypothetical protein M1833_006461 [Piccolia ochrophora]|nr:MAG: hypothetical protein M1833_006461 [Piccolia ochrophora]
MGKLDDAEVIRLDDIAYAERLTPGLEESSDGVDHVVRPPTDLANCGLFCRFAIFSAVDPKAFCITPITSSLLQHRDRWNLRNFSCSPSPLVFDLTPNVLGPSEGFSQAGCSIDAAFGFEQELHATWKIRYHRSLIFDGPPLDVFDEFASGKIGSPPLPPHERPRIALVAGENPVFRLNERNKQMPCTEEFLKPLDIMDAAAKSRLGPDFLVMLMPPALLHHSASGRFSSSIFKLLEHRLSVHIKYSPFKDHAIPQEQGKLIVVASPFCAPLPWHLDWPVTSCHPSVTVMDLIGDLAFEKSRSSQGPKGGFICSVPAQNNNASDQRNLQTKYIFNYQTGRSAPLGETPIDMNAKAISMSCNGPNSLIHPGAKLDRRDLLTVREIARLQGLGDDFVFFNSETLQYKDVLKALPPIVAQRVAKVILHVIKKAQMVKLDLGNPSRLNKRPRVTIEDVEEGA